jgi:hypothetical protein
MILWKHYIVLFGGFIDPGVRSRSISTRTQWTEIHLEIANYLQDLWVFDTQEYKWQQVEFKENERRPGWVWITFYSASHLHVSQSSLWFLVSAGARGRHPAWSVSIPSSGNMLMKSKGGYCKEYAKGKRPQGIALDDTWFLKWATSTSP